MDDTSALSVLASGLAFPEGPVLSPDGQTLYCVNVRSNAVSRLHLTTGTLVLDWAALPGTGRGNGATLGPDGALYIADVGAKRIARLSLEGGAYSLVCDTAADGKPFLGPNDLVFGTDGTLYFTDPDGTWDNPVAAVYALSPGDKTATPIIYNLRFPNGLALSPDNKTLYFAQSPLGRIDAFDLRDKTARVFAEFGPQSSPDGIRLHPDGTLWTALYGDGTVAQVSPNGKILARYPAGGANPTNLCFSPDGSALYITEAATHQILRLELRLLPA